MEETEDLRSRAAALGEMLENVRRKRPVIHCITNYVTANDCANILLACGASPVMADDEAEAAEFTARCGGLVLNLGTLSTRKIPAMMAAGRKANEMKIPAVLDPVGAGASKLRTETAEELLKNIRFSVIRGNISEIRALALGTFSTRGVEADEADLVTEESLGQTVRLAGDFAVRTGSVVSVSGAIDIAADPDTAYCIRNGRPEMREITGTGCMLSALTAAFEAANPGNELTAAAAAACALGLCGETAFGRMTEQDGNASFRNYLIDAVYRLTPEGLEAGAKFEIRRQS
ncbi:MAG: hydroxyethylthiazole kinase [Bacteroidales bacterium]|nr:hydroxyethylthiazole kinase [Bacteroidales bacterium]